MIKEDKLRIKDELSLSEKIVFVETVVSFIFSMNEYTPYLRRVGEVEAIINCFIEGVKFEEEENKYNCYLEDDSLKDLVDSVPYVHQELCDELQGYIEDVVDFNKKKLINGTSDIVERFDVYLDGMQTTLSYIANTLEFIVHKEEFAKGLEFIDLLDKNNISIEQIADKVTEVAKLDLDEDMKSVLDEKNQKIKELSRYKTMFDARNVLNE